MKTAIFISAAMLTTAALPAVTLATQPAPNRDGLALVVAAPWGQPITDVLAASGVPEAFPDRAPFGAFVVLSHTDSLERLYQSGAWFVLNGKKILELC